MFHLNEISRIGKSTETEGRLVGARGWGRTERIGVTASEHRASFWDDESALELDSAWLPNLVNILNTTELYT